MNTKKYLLYKLSSAQAEVALLEVLISNEDGTDNAIASQPANGGAAKQAAKVVAAKKVTTKKVEAEEPEELSLEVNEEAEDAIGLEDVGDEDVISEQDIVKAIQGLAVKMGKPYVAALLKKYKAKAIQDFKEKDYASILNTIESTLKLKK